LERRISTHWGTGPDYDAVGELVLDIGDDLRALGEGATSG
jgi:hypothetical protein